MFTFAPDKRCSGNKDDNLAKVTSFSEKLLSVRCYRAFKEVCINVYKDTKIFPARMIYTFQLFFSLCFGLTSCSDVFVLPKRCALIKFYEMG